MRLAVFGTGCVGLVTGTGLAELGHDVLCVDVDERRIAKLKDGVLPLHEPGLSELVRRNARAGRLRFGTRLDAPYDRSVAYVVAVSAPVGADDETDLSDVRAVTEVVAAAAREDATLLVKTTVPVGTCDALQETLEARTRVRLEVVSNPEFLKEGTAVEDFFRPDRVVVGARDERAALTVRSLYAPLQLSGERVVSMDRRSAELAKYAANAMLATRVSFMNEVARLCAATGADVHGVRLAVGGDARIGRRFLYAGPGYGGSCLPKDVRALAHLGRSVGVRMGVVEATHEANLAQAGFLFDRVARSVRPLEGATVALWGLAFKPETDDVRGAPSLALARALVERGARVVGHDPEARESFLAATHEAGIDPSSLRVETDPYAALDGAHGLVLVTEWRCYLGARFDAIRARLLDREDRPPAVIDARNVWRPEEVRRAGLRYEGIGVRVPPGP